MIETLASPTRVATSEFILGLHRQFGHQGEWTVLRCCGLGACPTWMVGAQCDCCGEVAPVLFSSVSEWHLKLFLLTVRDRGH
jgi:hypothetical protein